MMMMIFFAFLNTILSLALAAILAHKLTSWRDSFNCAERMGMGLMAGSVLLTIPLMWAAPSPFDFWSTALLRGGAVIYFLGRLSRHYRHWCRNQATIEQARVHQQERGR